jgi:transposase
MRSAKRPHRPEAAFFADPQQAAQRRYEALRAYFLEGCTAAQAAARFGYAKASVQAMVRDFRRGDRAFFAQRRPGPRVAPAKQAARDQVLRLRAAGHSITEITQALATTATPLNRTGVWELLSEEGYERLPTRPTGQRGGSRRDHPPRTRRSSWPPQPLRLPSDFAGLLLLVPGLVTLDLPGAVSAAHFPGTREVPAISSVLSLLALKATGRRRVSHVDDVATDPALATFAGLESLPKATALGTYSYRLTRRHDQALLAALGPAMVRTGQAAGTDFDLDFHTIMHYGQDVALETHYVPRRSQRTESVLTFFAHDGQTRNLVDANADLAKATQAGEALAFARHWQQATGRLPELLVFDSKVTTGAGLFELDQAGIRFLTLRARSAKLMQTLAALPAAAWTPITLDRTGPYRHPQVHEDRVRVRGCPVWLRQLAVRGLGHDQPTLILTNNHTAKPAKLVDRYAKRMTIEQHLAEQIRSFHLDALSSAVALNVDLDTTLTVWAQAAYDALRRRLPGYTTATPDTIWRRFVSTSGQLTLGPTEVVARIAERTYSPVLRSADLPEVEVPWWGGRRLRFEIAVGKK